MMLGRGGAAVAVKAASANNTTSPRNTDSFMEFTRSGLAQGFARKIGAHSRHSAPLDTAAIMEG
jgi:hypothetical protein